MSQNKGAEEENEIITKEKTIKYYKFIFILSFRKSLG